MRRLRAAVQRLSDAYDCWRGEHDWYTEWQQVRGRIVLVRAEPCGTCGAPYPRQAERREEWRP